MKMIYYDSIDVSEGNDVNKTRAPKKECQISVLGFNQMYAVNVIIH